MKHTLKRHAIRIGLSMAMLAVAIAPWYGQPAPAGDAFPGGVVTGSTMVWGTTQVVSTESTKDSFYPSLAVDAAGNVHVAWDDSTYYDDSSIDRDIFYKVRNATTGAWGTTQVVSTESTIESNSPSLAVDGAGNVHVAWYDLTSYGGSGTDRDIFYKVRNATTGTWGTTQVVSTESPGNSWYPSLAVDGAGHVHVAWFDDTDHGGSGTDYDIFYKVRNATTGTWGTTQVVSTESTSGSHYPSLAVDGAGNVHVAWDDSMSYGGSGTDDDIFYKVRDATTGTWGTTQVVSTESTSGSHYPSLAVDGAGNVHVAWYDDTNYGGSGTDRDIFYKVRNATTGTWGTTQVVSTESTTYSHYPSLAVDGAGHVHVAWFDDTNYGGSGTDTDIFYKVRNATTGAWGTTQVVSTESTGDSRFPSLAVDGAGNVHVAWDDSTSYGGSGTDRDIFYKVRGVPDQVTGLVATGGNQHVTLGWTAPGTGGSPITHYNVYRSLAIEGPYSFAGTNTTATGFVDPGLANGTTYHYTVAAVNAFGAGANSTVATATTWAVPGQVSGLIAVPGIEHVNLTWSAPVTDGGTPVTGYRVYWSTDNVSFTRIEHGNTTTFQHPGLPSDGRTHHYMVAAVNVVGVGVNSSGASATMSDTTLPVITLVSHANGSVHRSGTTISLDVSDIHGVSMVWFNWNDGVNQTVEFPYEISLISGDDTHVLHVFANDSAGNLAHVAFTFTTDDTPPSIELTSPANGTRHRSGTTISLDVSDIHGVSMVWFNWNDGVNQTVEFPYEISLISGDDTHVLHVFANDSAGNLAMASFTFTADDTLLVIDLVIEVLKVVGLVAGITLAGVASVVGVRLARKKRAERGAFAAVLALDKPVLPAKRISDALRSTGSKLDLDGVLEKGNVAGAFTPDGSLFVKQAGIEEMKDLIGDAILTGHVAPGMTGAAPGTATRIDLVELLRKQVNEFKDG